MNRKIIGVTVGTTINPQRMGDYIENGKSAYEIAVKNGFEGTEQGWLASLKGKDGKNGTNGTDGKTPVKGTDYFTPADKTELVSAVLAQIPIYDGEVIEE